MSVQFTELVFGPQVWNQLNHFICSNLLLTVINMHGYIIIVVVELVELGCLDIR